MRRRCVAVVCAGLLALGCAGALAADSARTASSVATAAPSNEIQLRGPDVGFPGIGRVLVAFGVCAVLAAGAAIVLRRYWPGFGGSRAASGGTVRVVERVRVDAQLRLHVIDAAGSRLLIVESRSGVAIAALPPPPPPPPPG